MSSNAPSDGPSDANSKAVEVAARLGMLARALLYLIVGLIAIEVARGRGGERADSRGALEAVGRQPFGRLLLVAFTVGLAGYAVWRFAQAVRADSWVKRIAAVGKGLIYVGLLVFAVRLVVGRSSGQSNKEADYTARIMQHTFGRQIVFAIGVALIVTGLGNAFSAVTGRWKKHMNTSEMEPRVERWVTLVAVVGLLARATVFCLIGGFVIRAAMRFDPNQATGLDGALKRLAARSYGPLLLLAVAIGLFAYGLYCLVMARYRSDV